MGGRQTAKMVKSEEGRGGNEDGWAGRRLGCVCGGLRQVVGIRGGREVEMVLDSWPRSTWVQALQAGPVVRVGVVGVGGAGRRMLLGPWVCDWDWDWDWDWETGSGSGVAFGFGLGQAMTKAEAGFASVQVAARERAGMSRAGAKRRRAGQGKVGAERS